MTAAMSGGICPSDPSEYFSTEEAQALLARIAALPGRRSVLAVAGAPGSGKSTLAAALVARLPGAVLVPMDGFHLDNPVLEARGLIGRKGAPETFDADGFVALIARLQAGGEVVFPVFDRRRDFAIAGAGVVPADCRLVVVEGNYLLLDRAPWNQARYDLSVLLAVDKAELRRRLTARWQGLGCDTAEVAAHLANDLANAGLVAANSRAADLVLQPVNQDPGQR